MKLLKKYRGHLFAIFGLCIVIGTLAWEIVERVLLLMGVTLDLTVGPVGFDLRVLAVQIMANPGTVAGLIAGVVLVAAA
jgi:hypothetical protein